MNAITPQPSCADAFDIDALPVPEAQRRIQATIEPLTSFEKIALRSALGRIVAQTIVSPIAVPAHTNAAVDGYAVCMADVPESSATVELPIIGTAWAGSPFAGTLEPGNAVRIMTGAVVPQGADCIIMQEHTERVGERVRIGTGHRVNQNIRQAAKT